MKNILTVLVMSMFLLSIMPALVLADGAVIDEGGSVVVGEDLTCNPPEIFVDHTARGWFPNDQTWYTADHYGFVDEGGKYDLGSDYDKYVLANRQAYAFTGETLDYYVLVRDIDGVGEIDSVNLLVDGELVGACAQVDYTPDNDAFGVTYSALTDDTYVCKLIVQSAWNGELPISVQATSSSKECAPETVLLGEADWMTFNPTLTLDLVGGPISFGAVTPGSVATSNTVRLANVGEDGVVMDMYVASDDYFTDPSNPNALCPTGNGIKYSQFSYYATKGSLNSGLNGKTPSVDYGLGDVCVSNSDEFTTLPSHSGEIADMCRIINTQEGSSFLAQGSEMALTFKLNVPSVCHGSFTDGQFHFAGRVL